MIARELPPGLVAFRILAFRVCYYLEGTVRHMQSGMSET